MTIAEVRQTTASVPVELSSIKRARISHGLSVHEFSRRLGVTPGAVSQMERSEAADKIGIGTLRGALAALGEDLIVTSRRRGDKPQSPHRAPFPRREDRVTYELHRAVAKKIIDDPEFVLSLVPSTLEKMRRNVRGPLAERWLAEWESLVLGPIGNLIRVMLGEDNEAKEMRQNSPFSGALTQAERLDAIARASQPPGDSHQAS